MTARSRRTSRHAPRAGFAEGVDIRIWLDRGIEAAWLIAAVVTPLIVLSETAVLSKTSLPKVATVRLASGLIFLLMLIDIGMSVWQRGVTVPHRWEQLRSRGAALFADTRSIVMTSVVVLLATTALVSVFALMPSSSIWGVDRGGESNSLYSTATFVILFFAVATRLKTPAQLWRLFAAMILAGTLAALVGIAQHFEYAPFGIRSTSGSARVSGTSGNPIFFATLLIITMVLTIGMSFSVRDLTRRSIGWLSLYGLVIAIHLTALMLTLSRGPWIGAGVGVFAIAVLSPLLFRRQQIAVTGALVVVAFLMSLMFLAVSSDSPPSTSASPSQVTPAPSSESPAPAPASETVSTGDSDAPTETPDEDSSNSPPEIVTEPVPTGSQRTSVGDVQGRVTSLTGVFHPVTNTRIVRWDGSLKLARNRPEPTSGAQPGFIARTLFGYGPDTFPDVFTMVAPRRLSGLRTVAAHNIPLNRLVETGLLGLLAWMAMWSSLAFLLLQRLWTNRREGGMGQVVTLAIGAALAAWFIAGLTGIPRSGDLVLVWLLAGVAVAVPRVFPGSQADEPANTSPTATTSTAFSTGAVVAIGVIALATVWVTWTETVQRVSADLSAASSVSSDPDKSSFSGRVSDIDRAIELAPDESEYHLIRSEFYERLARESGTTNPIVAMQESLASVERALALNPLDRDINFRAAYVNWEVAKMGDADAAFRTYSLYQDLLVMSPRHHQITPRLAAVSEALGLTP